MMNIIETNRLLEAVFQTGDGERYQATYTMVYQWLNQEYGLLMAVILLCLVVAVMLWVFLAYHLHLVRNGFTTNESSKYSHYKHYLKMTSEFFAEWSEMRDKDPNANPSDDDLAFYRVEKTWTDK